MRMKFMTAFLMTFFLMFLYNAFSSENPPMQIGVSHLRNATENRNGRLMVRDSNGLRMVLFKDSTGEGKFVKLVYSQNGIDWSAPVTLDKGLDPCIAISDKNTIYAAWTAQDFKSIKLSVLSSNFINPLVYQTTVNAPNRTFFRHPSLEVTKTGIHLVWEQQNDSLETNTVYYQSFMKWYLSPFVSPVQLSSDSLKSVLPVVTGDLEYNPGSIPVFWTSTGFSGIGSEIWYCTIDDNTSPAMFPVSTPVPLRGFSNRKNPSVSVRNDNYYKRSYFVIVCEDVFKNGFYLSWSDNHLEEDFIETTSSPTPVADDIAPSVPSCAIVYQDSGKIKYCQTVGYRIITRPSYWVSNQETNHAYYPSICYKKFRADSFDVVWTEGDKIPFSIMYRRMAKQFPKVVILRIPLPSGAYKNEYLTQITVNGYGRYYFLEMTGKLPKGIQSFNRRTDWININGAPQESGVFPVVVILKDYFRSPVDTALFSIVITNTKPEICSSDTVKITRSDRLVYHARAKDNEGNPSEFHFIHLPRWLSSSDSTVTGTPPSNASDTCFTVIASDGELADSLTVHVQITDSSNKVEDEGKGFSAANMIFQNYPNPFNQATIIPVSVAETGQLSVRVYDTMGRHVCTLFDGKIQSGMSKFTWEGKDRFNRSVPSGMYFIKAEFGKNVLIKKLLLLR